MRARRLALASAVASAVIVVALTTVAFARPGGGESFSGGGGHGGGGGGSGGGGAILQLLWYLVQLCIYYPAAGLPILGLIVGAIMWSAYKQRQNRDWDSGPPVALRRAVPVTGLRRLDPEFSLVVFEDFAFRLFSTAQRARGACATRSPPWRRTCPRPRAAASRSARRAACRSCR